jgi:hypothetical protein
MFGVMPANALAADQLTPALFQKVGDQHDVPADLLYAVARTESGRTFDGEHTPWPWTLNVAGLGSYFNSRAEACRALRVALEQTSLVDVGVAQLNVYWNPGLFSAGKRFSDPCVALDPHDNLDAAAAILRSHFDATGHWLTATGRYHRPAGGEAARRYAETVASHLKPHRNAEAQRSARSSILSNSGSAQVQAATTRWVAPVAMVWISPGG